MKTPLLALLIALLGAAPAAADEALIDEGRRLYRDGLRADGTPVEGRRHAGPPLRGRDIACVQCHRPSGLGTVEGVAIAPAITGRHLFSPGQPRAGRRPRQAPGMTLHDHGFRTRPAYDLLALARAMADGIGSMVQAWVLYGTAGPQAMRKMVASVLAGVAAQSAVLAIFELAKGFAALFFNPAEAAARTQSATEEAVVVVENCG